MPKIRALPPDQEGRVRYRWVVDVGVDPKTGRRKQLTKTFDRKREAVAELARITHERDRGDLVLQTKLTVNELLDRIVPSLTVDVSPATAAQFDDAMRPVRAQLGHRTVQSLDERDIDDLVDWMAREGRVRGGKPGTGLGLRSIQLTLGRLRGVLAEAVRRKLATRNVAQYTRIPRALRDRAEAEREERTPWSDAEVKAFLVGIRDDRAFGPLLLSLCGLRPAELCGLRWSDVDLDAGTLSISNTRTLVEGVVHEKAPKTRAGRRTLPIPAPVAVALRAFKAVQARERLALGPDYADSGYLLVDEAGKPWKTDQLRRYTYARMRETGARKVRPYDARHACLTHLAASGVPDVVVSAWAGHADLSLAKRVYVHPNAEHLREASDALARLLG